MRSLFFAFAFMLIGTFAFANDAKSEVDLKIEKKIETVKTTEGNYEYVVRRVIKGKSCTEYHVIRCDGEVVCEFEAEGEEPCGVTIHEF